MAQSETVEEVTINNHPPQQVVKKTTTQIEPQVQGEAVQSVYEKKKTIFRFNQIIWYVFGLIEALLLFRVILKALGANSFSGFTNLIYSLSNPFAAPFKGIFGTYASGNYVIEWSTIMAGIVYLCLAWGLIYLLELVHPITPKDVEMA